MAKRPVSNKAKCGPGGFRCPCCNPWGVSPAKAKPKAARHARRILKVRLKERGE